MEAAGDELSRQDQADRAGDVEEATQVVVQAAPHEEDPEDGGQPLLQPPESASGATAACPTGNGATR